ncbi:MAG TPA: hypothetical protein VKB05_14095 [Pyrinomonadaceae bacterium]|nr:hypothetical protein [Pyrinomonadaceae bacterium]
MTCQPSQLDGDFVRAFTYGELQSFDKACDDYERALDLAFDNAWLRMGTN